jgi:hypothetical protein
MRRPILRPAIVASTYRPSPICIRLKHNLLHEALGEERIGIWHVLRLEAPSGGLCYE